MIYSEGNAQSSKRQSWREERKKQKRRKRRRQRKQQQQHSPFGTRNPKHPAAEKTPGTPVTSNNRNRIGQPTTRDSKLRASRVRSPTRTRSQTPARTRRAAVATEVDANRDDYQHRKPPLQVGGGYPPSATVGNRWRPTHGLHQDTGWNSTVSRISAGLGPLHFPRTQTRDRRSQRRSSNFSERMLSRGSIRNKFASCPVFSSPQRNRENGDPSATCGFSTST